MLQETMVTLSDATHHFLQQCSLLGKSPIFRYSLAKKRVDAGEFRADFLDMLLESCLSKRTETLSHLKRMQVSLETLIDAVELLGGIEDEEEEE